MALCNINVETGAVYQSGLDLLLRGPIPFRFERDYDSQRQDASSFGRGWRHNQNFSLHLSKGIAHYTSPTGTRLSVPHPDEPSIDGAKLRSAWEGNAVLLTDSQKTVFRFEQVANSVRWNLTRRTDARGNFLAYSYWPDGVLQSVNDSRDRAVLFWQDLLHHICRITLRLPETRENDIDIAHYEFDLGGNLIL